MCKAGFAARRHDAALPCHSKGGFLADPTHTPLVHQPSRRTQPALSGRYLGIPPPHLLAPDPLCHQKYSLIPCRQPRVCRLPPDTWLHHPTWAPAAAAAAAYRYCSGATANKELAATRPLGAVLHPPSPLPGAWRARPDPNHHVLLRSSSRLQCQVLQPLIRRSLLHLCVLRRRRSSSSSPPTLDLCDLKTRPPGASAFVANGDANRLGLAPLQLPSRLTRLRNRSLISRFSRLANIPSLGASHFSLPPFSP